MARRYVIKLSLLSTGCRRGEEGVVNLASPGFVGECSAVVLLPRRWRPDKSREIRCSRTLAHRVLVAERLILDLAEVARPRHLGRASKDQIV